MSRRYPDESFDEHVDRVTDEAIQNEVDDRAESQDKRYASGISIEEMGLINAGNRGAQAGALDIAAGANPYPINSPEYAEWERRRFLANTAKHTRRAA